MDLKLFCANISNSRPSASEDVPIVWNAFPSDPESCHYGDKDERLGIDFQVTKLLFMGLQVVPIQGP